MKLFKTDEATLYTGISRSSLLRLSNSGVIKSHRTDSGHRIFKKNDLDAYIKVLNKKKDMYLQSTLVEILVDDDQGRFKAGKKGVLCDDNLIQLNNGYDLYFEDHEFEPVLCIDMEGDKDDDE